VSVTWVGHASVLLGTSRTRVLTDPLFTNLLYGLRRARAARVHPDDLAEVSLVLISHAHADHLHVPSLRQLPRGVTLVVPPRCGPLVERLGFARVVSLEPGQDLHLDDVTVTGVAAKHDGAGLLAGPWRGASGYVVRTPGVTVYFAGDTAYFSGFAELGRRMRPDVALLPIAGYEPASMREGHMSPLDALAAFEDLGAQLLVPIAHGSFQLGYEPLDEPAAWLRQLCAERGLCEKLRLLGHGETCVVRSSSAPR
jgi:L-ascorbate metabolism protein UlaG (beta-lactamase superfamily)